MTTKRAIGLDIGTSSISAIIMDGATGEIVETITIPNDANIRGANEWEDLQDPSVIINHIGKIVKDLETRHAPLACIGLTGQMHGIVYVDEEGNAVSPFYTWQDNRGNLEHDRGASYADHLTRISGYKLSTGYGAVTHHYNSVHNLIPKTARQICSIHDYAAMKLCGAGRPRMHPTNAASFGFFDLAENRFDRRAILAAGMDASFFPAVDAGLNIIGVTGTDVPVAIAIGDNQASFLGSVNDNDRCVLVNIGTSGQISLCVNDTRAGPGTELRPFSNGKYLLVGSSLCGGRAYALLENFFRSVLEMASCKNPPRLFDAMNDIAAESLSIENKLDVSTLFSGTRENPRQRATIANLGVENFTARHLIVGVLEGIVNELHAMYRTMEIALDHPPRMLIGSGNTIRYCLPLQKVVSDTFQMPIKVPLYQEEASYGAALFALAASGCYHSLQEVQSLVRYQ